MRIVVDTNVFVSAALMEKSVPGTAGQIVAESGLLHRGNTLPILTCKSKNWPMRITSKGQVTIPADIRERAGLLPHAS